MAGGFAKRSSPLPSFPLRNWRKRRTCPWQPKFSRYDTGRFQVRVRPLPHDDKAFQSVVRSTRCRHRPCWPWVQERLTEDMLPPAWVKCRHQALQQKMHATITHLEFAELTCFSDVGLLYLRKKDHLVLNRPSPPTARSSMSHNHMPTANGHSPMTIKLWVAGFGHGPPSCGRYCLVYRRGYRSSAQN